LALRGNILAIKKNLPPQQKFMAVVKANAYGHGLLEVVSAVKNDVDYLAVFDFLDAVFLRQKKISKPILVLGKTLPTQISLALKHDIEISVSTFDLLQAAKKISGKKKLKIHLCVDSGMHRDGFISSEAKKVLEFLPQKNLDVVGLYSHFASADEAKFLSYTKKQISELKNWQKELSKIGLKPLTHIAASAGSFLGKLIEDFDLVRVGVSLYGLWASTELKNSKSQKTKLQPALSWKALISEVKFLPKGSAISYGCTHILARDSKLAILPIGYFDGISRVSSNCGFVLVGGKKVPQIGRVTMNMIVLDVTDVASVKAGDVATIIGRNGKQEITADDWAAWSQTSNYEIVTSLGSHLKRRLI
jgi:alanine racemase